MQVLIVDNRDSFTFNLSQLVAKVTGYVPTVISNAELGWRGIAERHGVQAIIISPGPGTPDRVADFGTCLEIIRETGLPLLGVCLGHEGIGHAYGAKVVRAPVPMHGRISRVVHDGSDLFRGVPDSLEVVRYHSLCLDRSTTTGVPPGHCLDVRWHRDGPAAHGSAAIRAFNSIPNRCARSSASAWSATSWNACRSERSRRARFQGPRRGPVRSGRNVAAAIHGDAGSWCAN